MLQANIKHERKSRHITTQSSSSFLLLCQMLHLHINCINIKDIATFKRSIIVSRALYSINLKAIHCCTYILHYTMPPLPNIYVLRSHVYLFVCTFILPPHHFPILFSKKENNNPPRNCFLNSQSQYVCNPEHMWPFELKCVKTLGKREKKENFTPSDNLVKCVYAMS